MLETLSYQATLKRGFALVRTIEGHLVRSAAVASGADLLKISFADGDVTATPANTGPPPQKPPPRPKGGQGTLF